MLMLTRVMLNTLVYNQLVYTGSQWAIFIPRDVVPGVYKGPHVYGFNRTMQQPL